MKGLTPESINKGIIERLYKTINSYKNSKNIILKVTYSVTYFYLLL